MKKMYRKLGGTFLVLTLVGGLAACQTNSSPISPASNTPAESSSPMAVTEDVTPHLSLSQAFEETLCNGIPFFFTAQDRYPVYQENVFLSEITKEDQNTMSSSQFAVVDMDGDGTPEVVFQRSDYLGFVILRYQEGDVYGYDMSYRGLMRLKKDGSYLASSSATENTFGKMRFLGDFFDQDIKIYSEGQAHENYYMRDELIDKDAFDQLWKVHEELPDVDWHKCTDTSVKQWLGHDLALVETPAPVERQSAEMQTYLDSLSSLLYFNYYPGSSATSDDWEASSARYYDGWNQAMDAIYTLCVEKLPKDDVDALVAEQQQWLGTRNQIAGASTSQLGDMTKMRTYHLISLFWGDHFYD